MKRILLWFILSGMAFGQSSTFCSSGANCAYTGNNTHSGSETFSGSTIVPTPTLPSQAATKSYVDTASPSGALPLTGGTLTGALNGTSSNFSGTVAVGTLVPSISPYADVRAYGAKGDCSTDDTAAIQAALTTGYNVYLPTIGSCYKITALLTMLDGQWIFGDNWKTTVLEQFTANTGAVSLSPSGSYVYPGGGIRDLTIERAGATPTSGNGVAITGGSTSYNGDLASLRNVWIQGFYNDLYTYSWGQLSIENVELYNAASWGWMQLGGSANDYKINGMGCANAVIGCVQLNTLMDSYLGLRDFTGSAQGVLVQGTSSVVIDGGEFENNAGPAVTVAGNCSAVVRGMHLLAGSYPTVSPFSVASNSSLVVSNVTRGNYTTTTPMVTATGGTANVAMLGFVPTTLSATPDPGAIQLLNSSSGETSTLGPFVQRADNSEPVAAAALRGMVIAVPSRASAAISDQLLYYYRNAAGTATFSNLLAPIPVPGTIGNCVQIGAGNFPADSGSACGGGASSGQTFEAYCVGTFTANATLALFPAGYRSNPNGCNGINSTGANGIFARAGTVTAIYVDVVAAGVNSSSGVVTVFDSTKSTILGTCTVGTGTSCSATALTGVVSAGDRYRVTVTTQVGETLATMAVAFLLQ